MNVNGENTTLTLREAPHNYYVNVYLNQDQFGESEMRVQTTRNDE